MLWIKIWTESRERLPTYLLVGGLGLNVVHACNFFFFFWYEYKICLPGGRLILAHVFKRPRIFGALAHVFRGPKVLDLGSCFQKPRIFGSLLMFSRTKGFLGFGSCFQRTKGSGSWLMFSET